jgi:parallel beta-helix repeat protein
MRNALFFILFAALSTLPYGSAWGTSGTLTITTSTTLTENHEGNIVIANDSLTLDCADHTVSGTGANSGTGIELVARVGVTVTRCHVTNFQRGIFLVGSARNVFTENRVDNNIEEGFELEGAIGNLFLENIVDNNRGDGFDLDDSHENILKRNEVTRNGRNGIELDFAHNNIFEENAVDGNGRLANRSGFSIDDSRGNLFQRNIANVNDRNGFRIQTSPDNTFIDNQACGNAEGDVFQDVISFRNIFTDNDFCTDNLPRRPGLPVGFILPDAD